MRSTKIATPPATPFAVRLRQFLYAMLAARFMEFDPRSPANAKRE
jgi:hypothetical protein